MKGITKTKIKYVVLISVFAFGLQGCKSNRHKEFITQEELVKVAPIADQYTPNIVMQICDAEYDREYKNAISSYESENKRIDCDPDYTGGFTCKEKSRRAGGFWGGVASAINKRSAAKNATKGLKENCYLKYGYRLTEKVVRNPNYSPTRKRLSEPEDFTPSALLSSKSFEELQSSLDSVSRWSNRSQFKLIKRELDKRCQAMGRKKYNSWADRCYSN